MTSVSIDRIISKMIRDMRINDSTYITDMYEWIPEAMRLLNTQAEMTPAFQQVHIQNHQGPLPCGLYDLEAVEYNGTRLGYYTGVKHVSQINRSLLPGDTAFTTVPVLAEMPSGNVLDMGLVQLLPVNTKEGYQIHIDQISTTFANGWITIYFKEMKHDDRGLPLIPDQQDYKEALYWYNRAKVIQSGYKDPMYGNDDRHAWERFELHAARAISAITYPHVDQKEAQLAMAVRFVPPVDYYDSFFNSVNGEPLYGFSGPEGGSNPAMISNTPTSSLDLQN
jgi:hypothetical protein